MQPLGGKRNAARPPRYLTVRAGRQRRDLTLLVIGALILVGTGIVSLAADAAPITAQPPGNHPDRGLFIRRPDGSGLDRPVPQLEATVRIAVSGLIARVHVAQTFKNPDSDWVEGLYVFPLSRKGAVDHLLMRIGDRIVEGRIEERQAARKRYGQAKQSGRKASLVEQERPNLFTVSIANIPPDETVTVEIFYQEIVHVADGRFSLRFPMVVNPRYIPKGPQIAGVGGLGWGVNTATVPDAERITPPMRDPAAPKGNPVTLTADLDAGLPLAMLRSPHHPIQVTKAGDGLYRITLRDGPVPADRDFVLEWQPETGAAPEAALFAEQQGSETYLLAMVLPPTRKAFAETQRLPREAIFVIDTSGSMHGESIEQAQAALRFALDRLKPTDRFNIIGFSSKPLPMFAKPTAANQPSIAVAHVFVNALRAEGGTEMQRALDLVLDDRIDASRLRQLVLLTDGSVGNEAELFRSIRRGIGDSRLFTIGIGSAPNAYFMDKAAKFGRGTFTFIGRSSAVADEMSRLFAKLGNPVLTHIAVTLPDEAASDVQPERIPDLYLGEPIVIAARVPNAEGTLVISGRLAGEPWSARLSLASARTGKGIAKLWAKRKTAALMDELHEGVDPVSVRRAVLDVALPHQIMSRYTSLVAVDRPVSRPAQAGLVRRAVPTNPPAGWTPPGRPAETSRQRADKSALLRQLAQAPTGMAHGAPAPSANRPVGQTSPSGTLIRLHTRTATPAHQHLLIAAVLMGLALAVWFLRRRLAR